MAVCANLLVEISEVVHSKNHPGAREASACQVRELEPEPGAESPGVGDPEDKPRIVEPRAPVVLRIQFFLRIPESKKQDAVQNRECVFCNSVSACVTWPTW